MTFQERIEQGDWWDESISLLNFSDINTPPVYYEGSKWDWICEVTTYKYLYPKEWEEIFKAYLPVANAHGNKDHTTLHFYCNEEGYIRQIGRHETYLKLFVSDGKIADLKKVGGTLCMEEEKLRSEYLDLCTMPQDRKKQYIQEMERSLKERFPQVEAVEMAYELDESRFEKKELFYDFLNGVYIIL